MPEHEKHDTHQKALSLNLDPTTFGSFAEIGAGQEVARWFLRVGGASGTVAKTISAMTAAGELGAPANIAEALTIHHIALDRTTSLLA